MVSHEIKIDTIKLLQKKELEIAEAKGHDYADSEDALSNLKACERFDIPAVHGVMVRLSDKWCRLEQFVKKGEFKVNDEKLIDTIIDMRNYLAFLLMLYNEGERNE